MLLAELYDDATLDRFIGYSINQDRMDISSFKDILRDYNAGNLALPGPRAAADSGAITGYRDDAPALVRDCSYYEVNAMSEVYG